MPGQRQKLLMRGKKRCILSATRSRFPNKGGMYPPPTVAKAMFFFHFVVMCIGSQFDGRVVVDRFEIMDIWNFFFCIEVEH